MGLDVSAYREIAKLDALFDWDGEPVNPTTREPFEDYLRIYVSSDFPDQADDLEDKAVYSYKESGRFWSGSYGKYNQWREQLAKLANYAPVWYESIEGYKPSGSLSHQAGAFEVDSGAFYELICFTDCDGIIGAKTSAKLAKDFAEWDEKAKALNDEYFYAKYEQWRKCFEMAANNGAVSFH